MEHNSVIFMVKELMASLEHLVATVEDPNTGVGAYCDALRRAKNALNDARGLPHP